MIDIHGQTLSEFNSEKRAAVDEVRQAVETTLDTDSALQALVMDIYQISSTIDIGSSESRGFFLDQYVATYQYNHASP